MSKYRVLPYKAPQHALFLKRRRLVPYYALSVVLVVAIVLGGTATFLYRDLASAQTTDTQVAKLLQREAPPNDSYEGRAINILVMGSDRRPEGNAEHVEGMRSDTTILMHISADRSRIEAVSIPRDLMVDIPVCKLPNGGVVGPAHAQFNAAFSYGGMTGNVSAAIACTIKTVEQLSNIHIDEFIMVDMHSMAEMINALGGINLWSDVNFSDPNSRLDLKVGCNHLLGEQAVAFARTREGIGDGSDLQRIKRQQRLMSLMFRTAKSKNLTTDLPALYAFGRAALGSLTTSEGLQLTSLAGIAYSLSHIKLDNILFVSLPVASSNVPGESGRVVATSEAAQVWDAIRNDQWIPAGLEVRDGNGNAFIFTGEKKAESPSDKKPGEEGSDSKTGSDNGGDSSGKDKNDSSTGTDAGVPGRQALPTDAAPLSSSATSNEAARAKCEP